ncbi:MAG: hypothetical protein JWQ13_810 [Ramlibacter sp.]|nr:hypothetical protein [Ramlibacter sp.]
MPLLLLHTLGARERTRRSNTQLGFTLAFVAGAVNAGGFLAVHRYTSHMTGFISAIADNLVLGQLALALAAAAFLAAFTAGAASTAILVNWARHRELHSEYALPLALESLLLLAFGLLGPNLDILVALFVPTTVMLLCFIMGLQNAVITKISRAEIRTTHMTGVVTDIGIEIGRAAYFHGAGTRNPGRVDGGRLRILGAILALFLFGGVAGAAAFKAFGFFAVLPIAALLIAIAASPLIADLRTLIRAAQR